MLTEQEYLQGPVADRCAQCNKWVMLSQVKAKSLHRCRLNIYCSPRCRQKNNAERGRKNLLLHFRSPPGTKEAKRSAMLRIYYLIKTGQLKRPTECSACDYVGRVHGHHCDYEKKDCVIWLCPRCHHKVHRGGYFLDG